ncbi:MAG: response regulator [Bacteroidetes bacterium]|nr:response regulator [Bacteroidota bacterium]
MSFRKIIYASVFWGMWTGMCLPGMAQVFESFSLNEGLSHPNVTSIIQDGDGFIWVGTQYGLLRYDGYSFEKFHYEIDKQTGISHNNIRHLMIDRSNRLLVSTWGGGVNRFDAERQRFIRISDSLDPGNVILHDHVMFVHQNSKGAYWFGTLDGLVYYHPEKDSVVRYKHQDGNPGALSNNHLLQMQELPGGGCVFLCADGVVNYLDASGNSFRHFLVPKGASDDSGLPVTCMWPMGTDEILLGTEEGLYALQLPGGRLIRVRSRGGNRCERGHITTISKRDSVSIWVAVKGEGLTHGVIEKGAEGYGFSESNTFLFSQSTVQVIYEDRQGNSWIGTISEGMKAIINKQEMISYLPVQSPSVQAIVKDSRGTIWIGSVEGLYSYSARGVTRRYDEDSGLSSGNIRSLFADSDRLIIGTDRGLDVMDLESGVITLWRDKDGILSSAIVEITMDERGDFWMGSDSRGLIYMNSITGEVMAYTAPPPDDPSIGNYNVISLCEGEGNKLWVGIFGGGLNLFDKGSRTFIKRYLHDPGNPRSLNDNNIWDIFRDSRNNLWVGTGDGGLNLLDPGSGRFQAFMVQDGLPSNRVKSIIQGSDSLLWLSTLNGLATMNLNSMNIHFYDKEDGLDNGLFNNAKFADENLIYFGSNRGYGLNVAIVNRFSIHTHYVDKPVLHFTDFKIFNERVDYSPSSPLQKHISRTQSIVLDYNQTGITIDYVALNFLSPASTRYAVKMEGLGQDPTWQFVEERRSANYSNLPPGDYRFLVATSSREGHIDNQSIGLDIKVKPPLWRSRGAIILYVLIFLGINVLVVLLGRSFTLRKHALELARMDGEKEKQLNQFKLQFFTNISHELRTHLTLLGYPVKRLLRAWAGQIKGKQELEMIDLNYRRLLNLTNEIIDFRRVEQGKVEMNFVETDVPVFLREFRGMFSHIAEQHRINFELDVSPQDIRWVLDQERVSKVLFNLLSNAFKYTTDGGSIRLYAKVLIDVEGHPGSFLEIGVYDNGMGIDKEALPYVFDRFFNPANELSSERELGSSGIGLALVKQMVELHDGKVSVESSKNEGSHFFFTLPEKEASALASDLPGQISTSEQWERVLEIERDNVQEVLELVPDSSGDKLNRILVVDDNREIRLALAELLGMHYKVYQAENGIQALSLLEEKSVDIVLSDIMMPELDGIGLCKAIKERLETSHIPVILLTAKSGIDNEITGLKTGADAYITKPFSEERVLLTVENMINHMSRIQRHLSGTGEKMEEEIRLRPQDARLMERINEVIHKNLDNSEFSVDDLGGEVGLSRMHLFRKIKALTSYSPSDFIRRIKLEKGKALIAEGQLSLADIAYEIGFSSPGNFSTAFKKFYGLSPKQYSDQCFKPS